MAPGFVDAHTHLVFGGWRYEEYALRCKGASYLEIAEKKWRNYEHCTSHQGSISGRTHRKVLRFMDEMLREMELPRAKQKRIWLGP